MAETERTVQKFEVIEYEGKPARKYPDGTIRGEHGHILTRTSESARALVEQRYQAAKEAAISGMKKAAKVSTYAQAVEKIAQKRTEIAITDNGRAGNDAARLMLLMTDGYRPNQQIEVKSAIQNNTVYQMPKEYFEALDNVIKTLKAQGKIVEGEFSDANEG